LRENRQLITLAASDETLNMAFDWVCERRHDVEGGVKSLFFTY